MIHYDNYFYNNKTYSYCIFLTGVFEATLTYYSPPAHIHADVHIQPGSHVITIDNAGLPTATTS